MSKKFIVVPCYNEADRLNGDDFIALSAGANATLMPAGVLWTDSRNNSSSVPSKVSTEIVSSVASLSSILQIGRRNAVRTYSVNTSTSSMRISQRISGLADSDVILSALSRQIMDEYGIDKSVSERR